MGRVFTKTLFVALVFCVPALAGPKLKVGDPAPKLTVTEWLKDGPVKLSEGKGKTIYVVDFWATWCMPCIVDIPHLSKLQKQYADQDVVVLSVTGPGLDRRQNLRQARQFVKERGKDMGYVVGWDETTECERNWLVAADAMGLPHAFVVDRQGRIAWQGHPQAGLDAVLEKLVAGTYDLEAEAARAAVEQKIGQLLPSFEMAMRFGDHKRALSIIEEALALEPAHYGILDTVYQIHALHLRDAAAYRTWMERFIEQQQHNARAMTTASQVLMAIGVPAHRMPDLMVRTARLGYEGSQEKDPQAVAVYAEAAYRVGRLADAIRLQQRAVELTPETQCSEFSDTLKYYEACLRLSEKPF